MRIAVMKFEVNGKIVTRKCAMNQAQMGGEYTLCGCATPDSTMRAERFELVKYGEGKPNCIDCITMIRWVQSLEKV